MTKPGTCADGQQETSGRFTAARAFLLAGAAAAVLAGCALPRGPDAPGAPPAISAAPGHEPDFMRHLATDNLYELELSRLAAGRATNPRVRSLAQRLAAHRTQTRQQLERLMRSRGAVPPSELPPEKFAKLQQLQALPRSADFDSAFVRVVGIEDGQSAIAQLERARREARDPALVSWIDRTLPLVREDLRAAQRVAGELAG